MGEFPWQQADWGPAWWRWYDARARCLMASICFWTAENCRAKTCKCRLRTLAWGHQESALCWHQTIPGPPRWTSSSRLTMTLVVRRVKLVAVCSKCINSSSELPLCSTLSANNRLHGKPRPFHPVRHGRLFGLHGALGRLRLGSCQQARKSLPASASPTLVT